MVREHARRAMTESSELDELFAAMDCQVAAIVTALNVPPSEFADVDGGAQLAEHRELVRQLGALRDRVARAKAQICDPRELRAELATLLSFARTLRIDAEGLRARLREALEELVRQQAAARLERTRRAAEREQVLRRRDDLEARIVRAAEAIAQGDRAECRRTVPVIALDQDVTVCSMGVASPRRRFRSRRFWLVTLTDTYDEVLARRT